MTRGYDYSRFDQVTYDEADPTKTDERETLNRLYRRVTRYFRMSR